MCEFPGSIAAMKLANSVGVTSFHEFPYHGGFALMTLRCDAADVVADAVV
jgi:hypothetical protein